MRGANASTEWTSRQLHKIEAGVAELARLIGKRVFAVSDSFGLGDISAGTVLVYLTVRFSEFDWKTLYPSLSEYASRLEQRPSFQNTIPYPQNITDKVV